MVRLAVGRVAPRRVPADSPADVLVAEVLVAEVRLEVLVVRARPALDVDPRAVDLGFAFVVDFAVAMSAPSRRLLGTSNVQSSPP